MKKTRVRHARSAGHPNQSPGEPKPYAHLAKLTFIRKKQVSPALFRKGLRDHAKQLLQKLQQQLDDRCKERIHGDNLLVGIQADLRELELNHLAQRVARVLQPD